MATAKGAVVFIYVVWPDGSRSGGTGVLTEPGTVITSQHVVEQNKTLPSSIVVVPYGSSTGISVGPGAVRTNVPMSEWNPIGGATQMESGRDYASIKLNVPLGLSTGWFELNSQFSSGLVHILGGSSSYEDLTGSYRDTQNGTNTSEVSNITPATLRGGYSGSPVVIYHHGETELVGIVSAGVSNYAMTTDISVQTAARITGWNNQDNASFAPEINRAHVTNIFKICLGRVPDGNELTYWSGELGSSLPLSNAYSLAVTLPSAKVSLLFDTLFNRLPTQTELNDWVGKMNGGMTLHDVEASLLGSQAFLSTPGAGNTGAFIDQVAVNILGYALEGADRSYWVAQTDQIGRLAVLDAVSTPEVNALHLSIIGSINPLDAGVLV